MSWTAVLLILLSAVIHAAWNIFSKSRQPRLAFFCGADIAAGLLLLPVVLFHSGLFVHFLNREVILLLIATGAFMALYYGSLAGAYRSGDMSIAYPLARSSPIIVVTAVSLLLGRGEQVSTRCVAGIVLVVAGCFLLPMRRLGEVRLRNYWNRCCFLALAAAFGTAGYSICDDEALRILRRSAAGEASVAWITLAYAFLESVSASLWMGAVIACSPTERRALRAVVREGKRSAMFTGAAIYGAYFLVLVAMAFARNVSYVVAFRQVSIPLGALVGVAVLREPGYAAKYAAVFVIFAGLVLVGTG